jgi:hypothetical protein
MALLIYSVRKANENHLEVPDEPYYRAKAERTLRIRKLRDLVDEGRQLRVDAQPRRLDRMHTRHDPFRSSRPPLNPKHLARFGRR